jgi:hypothetical protein
MLNESNKRWVHKFYYLTYWSTRMIAESQLKSGSIGWSRDMQHYEQSLHVKHTSYQLVPVIKINMNMMSRIRLWNLSDCSI